MIGTLALILVAMGLRDVLNACSVGFIAQGHGWLGGLFDGFGDVAQALSIVITGLQLRAGAGVFLASCAALLAGSILGTRVGVWLTHWIDQRFHLRETS